MRSNSLGLLKGLIHMRCSGDASSDITKYIEVFSEAKRRHQASGGNIGDPYYAYVLMAGLPAESWNSQLEMILNTED